MGRLQGWLEVTRVAETMDFVLQSNVIKVHMAFVQI